MYIFFISLLIFHLIFVSSFIHNKIQSYHNSNENKIKTFKFLIIQILTKFFQYR